MSLLIEKPHLIFFISIPVIMLLILISGDAVLDVSIRDSYYLISYFHLASIISLLLAIMGFGYWMMLKANKELSKWLSLIHMSMTFGGALIVLILVQLKNYNLMDDLGSTLNAVTTLVIICMILGQLTYPINLFISFLRKTGPSTRDNAMHL